MNSAGPVSSASRPFAKSAYGHLPVGADYPSAGLTEQVRFYSHAAGDVADSRDRATRTNHPALRRYYELVGEMQRHYGQELNVGATLDDIFAGTGRRVQQNRSLVMERSARDMTQLHVPNLRTWGKNEYAAQAFDRRELDQLEEVLDSIASGVSEGGMVRNTVKQIVAKRA